MQQLLFEIDLSSENQHIEVRFLALVFFVCKVMIVHIRYFTSYYKK